MDYKDTLNLPRTDFPMKADLVAREPQRLEKWESGKLYEKIQGARAGAEKFVLHDGPPFANGDVHIGTALNKIIKDIIVKYKTLRGFESPYIPGWDCHGLPIEFKVTQEMRKEFEAHWSEVRKQHEESWITAANPISAEAAVKILAQEHFLSAKNVREKCEAYARKYIDIQRAQFKRLGVLGDWENPYLTLDKKYEAEQLRLFARIVEKGFVYRGKKPVYWSIPARTALAEAEVEYHDHVSQSVFVKFKLDEKHLEGYKEEPNSTTEPFPGKKNSYVVIWTTTPWTLPANLAVAYSDNLTYSWIENKTAAGVEYLLVGSPLAQSVIDKAGLKDAKILPNPYSGGLLGQLTYHHPFCNRPGKFFAGNEFVTGDTGTGFVHIAPGHGLEDYNLGRQNGLAIYSPVDDDGRFAYTDDLPREQQMPAEMIGKSILEKHGKSDANEAVLHELRLRHALLHQENYHHSYPYCWRSKTATIFRAMDQWFIKLDGPRESGRLVMEGVDDPELLKAFMKRKEPITGLRREAVSNIERSVKWIPFWGKSRILAAVISRPDWCISRQRTWGVPIPAFFDGKDWILNPEIILKFAELIEETGSSAWFTTNDARQLLVAAHAKKLIPPEAWTDKLKKSNDTLDVWIDSGSSSEAVLKARKELHHENKVGDESWRADMYLEGSDQHRGWFQSTLLLSLAGNGAAPFKTVLTHGFMVDADREKISKSKQGQGVYEKPQTAEAYVKKWGADIVRLWVSSQDFRNDIVVSEERVNKVAETYRGIRNTLRYQISNLFDFDPAKHSVADDKLTGLDRWILAEFSKLETEVIAAYDKYEFHVVYQKISQFVAVELSSIYHDVVKDRLYTDAANSHRRRSTQTALYRLVTGLCEMLAPVLAFSADEAWEFVPGRAAECVHQSVWEPTRMTFTASELDAWARLLKVREYALPFLEKARQSKTIGKALDAKVTLLKDGAELEFLKLNGNQLKELLNVSQLEFGNFDPKMLYEAGALEIPHVEVSHADGQKCERCWHWETDVGSTPEHPTICARCVEAIKQAKT
jgi:isoleucyl-tRNA synthetase